jgi:hypothetical protein
MIRKSREREGVNLEIGEAKRGELVEILESEPH